MREIKFRGLSDDEWVYGLLIKTNEGDTEHGELFEYLIQTDEKEYGEYNKYFITDKETIGQYTGLKDKNGKEIYEGDIVKIRTNIGIELITNIFYRDCAFRTNCAKEFAGEESLWYWYANDSDIEVIGNIYDNSDLLKAGG